MDDFEAFRKKKLAEKNKAKGDAAKAFYEFKVEEKDKAKGLVSHRQKLRKLSADDIPKIKGFDSHISRSNLDPETLEKFGNKKLDVEVFVPSDDKSPLNFNRVEGVGVSALIDYRL